MDDMLKKKQNIEQEIQDDDIGVLTSILKDNTWCLSKQELLHFDLEQ